MAMGIIDAGGRNCTISLQTQTGNLNMPGIVGAAVFTQYWYWFPCAHMLSLSFTPTAVIGVDQKLDVPVFKFHSNTRPSTFDYPPEQTAKADEAPEKVKTAILSTTAQAKRRQAKKEKQEKTDKGESMDIDVTATQSPVTPKVEKPEDKMETEETPVAAEGEKKEGEAATDSEKPEKKKKAEKEKVGYDMKNMSRVLPGQLKYLSFPEKRFQPVKKPVTGGVIVVLDTQPDDEKETIPLTVSKINVPPVRSIGGTNAQTAVAGTPQTPARGIGEVAATTGAGAAAAAGVLTAVDEDEEGAEEAPVPAEFEYESENEGDAMEE
jgi:26S proteasome regulatory subunit N2